jgi:AbrB family looped-hinge helix DNA binding protein
MKYDDSFYGSVTIGERGQVVIPAEARAALGYHPGDKLLVLRHPVYDGIMFCKIEALQEMMSEFAAKINQAHEHSKEETE